MRKILTGMVGFLLLTAAGLGWADAQTAEEACRLRNAASCELSGLKFFIDDDCPKGAKVLRPHGKERCDAVSLQDNAVLKPQADAAAAHPVPLQAPASGEPATEAETDYFSWPILLPGLFGFLFALFVKTGRWTAMMAFLLPALAAGAMLYGGYLHAVEGGYAVRFATAYLLAFVSAAAGWFIGVLLRPSWLRLGLL